ncbi:MAG: SAM-dependent methyltransferase [Clostridiales bacterium]|nr:SAM-dependent methyltransferase [Clostridiales bacterium]MCF8021908.1 SAM-dependent methyltransferase [Clostridiales bacterium]
MVEQFKDYIKNLINKKGPITFEEFMDNVLYHEQWGYYNKKAELGKEGDFYTSPHVNPIFGSMLAKQLYEMWNQAGKTASWHLVEYGPGEGVLSRDILKTLKEHYHDFFNTLTYWCVEKSWRMINKQKENIETSIPGKVKFINNLNEIEEEGITGCIFSNELLDSFPVHIVKNTSNGLKELYVDYDNNNFIFTPGEVSTGELQKYFELQNIELEPGQTAEVNLNAIKWLQNTAKHLVNGYIMTIDYGTEAEDLYSSLRFDGTLRCFSKHQLSVSPFENIGNQDITTTVNFTAQEKWGEKTGLENLGLVTQSQFLLNLGILEEIRPEEEYKYDAERTKKTMAVKHLIMPEGMGRIFKVLIQYKGNNLPVLSGTKQGRGI